MSQQPSDKDEQVKRLLGLFDAAGIKILAKWELPNGYWPEAYTDLRAANPRFLIKTTHGLVRIGWRKRVIEIEWSDTPVRAIVTEDDTTKGKTMVHAWSYEKALAYLIAWKGVAAALPELGRSREDVYRRGFTLTLSAALAGGWLEEDKEMRNKVIAYLGTAPLDCPDQTCEKILNDALGIPTDADRAFVSTTGTIQAGQSHIASTIVVGGQHILSQPHPAQNASEPAVPNGHYAEIRFGGAAWIPMKDRQPADFQTVLCVNSNHWMAVANRFYKDHAGRWNASHVAAEDMHDDLIIGEITHWRELPDAPALSATQESATRPRPKGFAATLFGFRVVALWHRLEPRRNNGRTEVYDSSTNQWLWMSSVSSGDSGSSYTPHSSPSSHDSGSSHSSGGGCDGGGSSGGFSGGGDGGGGGGGV